MARHSDAASLRARRGSLRMKLSDYIVERLAEWGVRHIFLVTGGGAMHLNDSIGHEPRIQYVCNHHEQHYILHSVDNYAYQPYSSKYCRKKLFP